MNLFKRKTKTNGNNATQQLEIEVTGMTCGGCATHVEEALRKVKGVLEARVPAWQKKKAVVTMAEEVAAEKLTKAIGKAGYGAKVLDSGPIEKAVLSNGSNRHVEYDLVVIGTGGGGVAAAIRAAENGARVAIVEAGTIGGTCVNIGCVPSKTLIRAAEAFHIAGHQPFVGVNTKAEFIDWPAIRAQKDALVGTLRQQKYVEVLKSYKNITLIQGWASLDKNGDVVVDGRILRADKVVIATGAKPKRLPIDGIETVEVLDSTSLMEIEKLPESLIVIGGRAVALELGQAFARFGTKVTVLQRSERLLPEHEPEIGEALANYLRAEGIDVETGSTPQAIREENGAKIITAKVRGEPRGMFIQRGEQREFRAEHVFMAVGRRPNTKEMGLEKAGVELDEKGFIIVDAHLQTGNPKIYAAGDVTTLPEFVYVAAAAGGIAAENALNGNSQKLDLAILPAVIFTDPQIATVGLTEAQAREKGCDVKISNLPLEYVPRALAARNTRGFIKLVADRDTDRLLGAHVLASEGGEIIQTAALAIKFGREHGFTVAALRNMLFPYLTQVEGIKLAAQTFEKDVAMLSCCAG
ncbi:MAG: mercury(II) reductase [bacterium]